MQEWLLKPDSKCPYCDHEINLASPTGHNIRGPAKDDINICIKCAGLMMFTKDLGVRKITTEEWEALDEEMKVYLFCLQRALRVNKARLN